jgi:hypothetical protein
MPLSRTEITNEPSASMSPSISIRPPELVNFTALEMKLRRIWVSRRSSPCSSGRLRGRRLLTRMFSARACGATTGSSTTSTTSKQANQIAAYKDAVKKAKSADLAVATAEAQVSAAEMNVDFAKDGGGDVAAAESELNAAKRKLEQAQSGAASAHQSVQVAADAATNKGMTDKVSVAVDDLLGLDSSL